MHDLNWAQTDFTEQSQAFAEKIFADVRLLSQSPAPLTGVTRTSYSPEEGRVPVSYTHLTLPTTT